METDSRTTFVHWNYFAALDQDLAKVSRFIEFDRDNFATYSIELAHVLLAASSEVDVVLKALCTVLDPESRPDNINEYRAIVKREMPELASETCEIPRYAIAISPFAAWSGDDNPLWWTAYNRVKHQRNDHFREANLGNTIEAIGALALVVLHFYFRTLSADDKRLTIRDVTEWFGPEHTFLRFPSGYYHQQLQVA